MQRQGLFGRKPKRRKRLTKQGETAPKFGDLLRRDFTAPGPERQVVWRHHRDPHRRRQALPGHRARLVLAAAAGLPDQRAPRRRARLPTRSRSLPRSVAARQVINGVDLPHRPRLDLHRPRFHPAMQGRNSASGSLWAALAHASTTPPPSRSSPPSNTRCCPATTFATKPEARKIVLAWCHGFYNTRRRHSSAAMLAPAAFEMITADQPAAA